MKYVIQATIGDEVQGPFESDSILWVPNVGDIVSLVPKGGPQQGKVKRRTLVYFSAPSGQQQCTVNLTCDRVTVDNVE